MPFHVLRRSAPRPMVRTFSILSDAAGGRRSVCALMVSILAVGGCQSTYLAQWSERQTVNDFAAAIAAEDPEKARSLMSSEFSSVVLSGDEAFDEIQRVWPVTGELEIVKIKDVEETERQDPAIPEKMVTVKDERGWETNHRLILDAETGEWVVDEILVTSSQRGVSVTKTVSEQIEFSHIVQDFAKAWRNGNREARLTHLTPACRAELETLPDEVLSHVAGEMFPPNQPTLSTEQTMDEDIAIVRMRNPTGIVLLQMKRLDGRWLIDDAAYESSSQGETIPSLRRTAVAYGAATEFLRAYAAADLEKLKKVTAPSFFQSTLKIADLGEITLPRVEAARTGSLRLVGGTGEMVIETNAKTFRIALAQTNEESNVVQDTEFRVEDVTIYAQNGQVKKNLAAALVAEPTAKLFVDALIDRDLPRLKALATNGFGASVWDKLASNLMPELPLGTFQTGEQKILSIVHNGQTTEVTMMQAGRAMTVVLHDEAGEVKVDDVLVAVANRPESIKATLAQYLPVARFTYSLKLADLDGIRAQCTRNFNRSIWSQVDAVPRAAEKAIPFLEMQLSSLQATTSQATIHLGEKNRRSMITMIKHGDEWQLDEITLITGPNSGDRVALKETMRDNIANGTLVAGTGAGGASAAGILQVSHEGPSPKPGMGSAIQPASYQEPLSGAENNVWSEQKEPRPFDMGQQSLELTKAVPIPEANDEQAAARNPWMEPARLPEVPKDQVSPMESAEQSKRLPTPQVAQRSETANVSVGPAAPFDAPLW